jgi:hypothetical protein
MRRYTSNILAVGLVAAIVAIVWPDQAKSEGPCAEIINRCKAAGFKPGQGSMNGLWFECVEPIYNRHAPPGRTIAPLPSIDPKTVNDCRTNVPDLLKGKINESKQ